MTATATLDTLRVDSVGSFLRPQALKDAFEAHAAGKLDEAGLRAAQDAAIRELIKAEEAHGMPIVGDGEFRRRNFNQSFAFVGGMEPWYARLNRTAPTVEEGVVAAGLKRDIGNEFRTPVSGPLKLLTNVPLEEYRFVAANATKPATVTLLSVDRISGRYAYEESPEIYPTTEAFADAVVGIQKEMVKQLWDAGCRYIHIDAPSYTAYVDEQMLAGMKSRGEDPQRNLSRSLAADNAVAQSLPGATFGIHLCRGNAQGMWHRRGSYDAIAERLFNTLAHTRFLLEYDDERSGGFEPLRFVPKGKVVVLGLISTKTSRVETVDELRRRIEEAAKYLPLDQLALSPQCGFSSGLQGNPLTEDEQWRKVDTMLRTAQLVWGSAIV
jgi:5-methyltetrahydropteroyltriglutamate--homocysteine methyltransferase